MLNDDDFLARFDAADLPALPHTDHLRAAWLCLRRDGTEAALPRLADGLRRFAAAKGAPGKFHFTLTRAWLTLLEDAHARDAGLPDTAALLRRWPALAEPTFVHRFYTPAAIDSTAAREGWVPPDRAPLTVAGDRFPPHDDPFVEFDAAIKRAMAQAVDPTPMTLATADAQGRPSARIVLLRGADPRGFVFHTNYTSRKGHDLDVNPFAALCLHWAKLEEQIRIEGAAVRLPVEESDAYFASRPRGHQIGAWASLQSQRLDDRATLEHRVEEVERLYEGVPVPRPPHWGGFRIVPDRIEFWKGQVDRLHQRVVYTRPDGRWRHELLFP